MIYRTIKIVGSINVWCFHLAVETENYIKAVQSAFGFVCCFFVILTIKYFKHFFKTGSHIGDHLESIRAGRLALVEAGMMETSSSSYF